MFDRSLFQYSIWKVVVVCDRASLISERAEDFIPATRSNPEEAQKQNSKVCAVTFPHWRAYILFEFDGIDRNAMESAES